MTDTTSSIVERLRSAGAIFPSESAARTDAWPVTFDPSVLDLDDDSFARYAEDYRRLTEELVAVRDRMVAAGDIVAFGDGEGELMYLLVRALRPKLVFEISPANGWSTNYLLAALTANGEGHLHSFEIDAMVRGRPTEDVIRGNLVPCADQGRLTVHIGDATRTVAEVDGDVDFILLDSSHEAFFAEWYTQELFRRVRGLAFVQDIHFWDRPEASGEAYYFIDWAARRGVRLASVEAIEQARPHRPDVPERWPNESNAVLVWVDGRGLPEPVLALGGGDQTGAEPIALLELGRLDDAVASDDQTIASLVRLGQHADGEMLGAVARKLDGRDGAPVEAAQILSRAGHHASAVAIARRALAEKPASLPIRVATAEVLIAAGEADEARSVLRAADAARTFAMEYRYLLRASELLERIGDPYASELWSEARQRGERLPEPVRTKFLGEYVRSDLARGRRVSKAAAARAVLRSLRHRTGRNVLRQMAARRLRG